VRERSLPRQQTRQQQVARPGEVLSGEPLPVRRERADAAVRAVRGDEQRVEPKELRNFRVVARPVLVERRASEVRSPKCDFRNAVTWTIGIRQSKLSRFDIRHSTFDNCPAPGFFNSMTTNGRPLTNPTKSGPVNSEADSRSATGWLLRNGDKSPSARPRICGCGSKPLCASTHAG